MAGTLLPPPPPLTSRELATRENIAALGYGRPVPNTPGAVFDRQLVTGRRRELLLEWLPQVCDSAYTTTRQRTVPDGLGPGPTMASVQTVMTSEGFEEIAQLTALHPTGAGSADGDVDLLFVHWDLGLIAFVHAPNFGNQGPTPAHINVVGTVEALDHELLTAAWCGARPVFDDQHRRTHHCTGEIHRALSGRGDGGSLRVALAAIRAFSRPTLPWPAITEIAFGRDGTSSATRRRAIAALPHRVHDVFGPHLLTRIL